MSEPLCLAVAFRDQDGGYSRHVGAMLASVLDNTRSPLRVHVLHDETLTSVNAEHFRNLLDGHELVFHPLDPAQCLPGVDESSPIMRPLTFATLYRLFLPQLVNDSRLIYMDTDLIVDLDLGELWDTPLHGALLGAVPDPCLCGAAGRKPIRELDAWAAAVARHSLALGVPFSSYFNAGVLLLDLASIRQKGCFGEALDFVLSQPRLLHPDQDALNKVFFGRTRRLDSKFNYLLHSMDVNGIVEGVWHYSGPRKPWDVDMPKNDRYRHYLARTPWA